MPCKIHLIAAARPNFMKVAPLYHALAAQSWCTSAALELRIVLRNGEQLLLALVLPLAALIGGTLVTVVDLPEPRIDTVTPGVLALAVLSSAFTSQAIVTAFDRRYGLLKRLAAAGMSRVQLLAGKAAATLAVVVGQCVVLGAVALAMGWSPAGGAAGAILLVVLGTATFLGLGLLLGGTVRAELALGLANLGWLVFVVVGGVLIPLDICAGLAAHCRRAHPGGRALAVTAGGAAARGRAGSALARDARRLVRSRAGSPPYGGFDGSDRPGDGDRKRCSDRFRAGITSTARGGGAPPRAACSAASPGPPSSPTAASP